MDGRSSQQVGEQQPVLLLVVFYQVLEYLRFITVVFTHVNEHSLICLLITQIAFAFFQKGCGNFLRFKQKTGIGHLFLEG